MKRKKFLQITTTLIGGLSISCFPPIKDKTQPIKIGLITDLHYANRAPPPGNNRYYSESVDKLIACIDTMNEQQVDFLIQLGDFKDQNEPPNEITTLGYLSRIENEFSKFNGPFFHVLGNHDLDSISKQQYLNLISNWGFKNALNYYSFNFKGFHFIVLDANYTTKEINYNRGNFDWKDTLIPTEQIAWLKNDLISNKDKATIVFIHQRLDDIEEDKAHFVKNAFEIRKIFEKSGNVLIVLQGHFHNGAINIINNIYYYTLKAAVEGSGNENNCYAILDINTELEMKLTGFYNVASNDFT